MLFITFAIEIPQRDRIKGNRDFNGIDLPRKHPFLSKIQNTVISKIILVLFSTNPEAICLFTRRNKNGTVRAKTETIPNAFSKMVQSKPILQKIV